MEYHYWNKDNFESLSRLAKILRETPELVRLAEYCELREKGVRKQALAALRAFLADAAALSEERRLALSIRLLDLHHAAPQAHQFLTQPLVDEFIRPSLRKAIRPGNAAFRYYALLLGETGNYKNALRAVLRHDPADVLVRKRLADKLLGEADFAMHHLNESFFIGSEAYCRAVLDEAARLLDPALADAETFSPYLQDLAELNAMLADWLEYKEQDRDLSFPAWCEVKGREYGWSVAYYYKAPSA